MNTYLDIKRNKGIFSRENPISHTLRFLIPEDSRVTEI
mgnify:CR=1 FL=1